MNFDLTPEEKQLLAERAVAKRRLKNTFAITIIFAIPFAWCVGAWTQVSDIGGRSFLAFLAAVISTIGGAIIVSTLRGWNSL